MINAQYPHNEVLKIAEAFVDFSVPRTDAGQRYGYLRILNPMDVQEQVVVPAQSVQLVFYPNGNNAYDIDKLITKLIELKYHMTKIGGQEGLIRNVDVGRMRIGFDMKTEEMINVTLSR